MDRLEIKGDEMMELQLKAMDEAVSECMYLTRRHANTISASVTEWSYSYDPEKKSEAREKVLETFEKMREALSEMVNLYKRSQPLTLLACEIETEAMRVLERIKPAPEPAVEGCEGTDCE